MTRKRYTPPARLWTIIAGLATDAGMQVVTKAPSEGDPFRWDGTTIQARTSLAGELIDPCELIHELDHFLVAPRWRRRIPGYGLGDDQGSHFKASPRRVSRSAASREEMVVTTLDALRLLSMNAAPKVVRDWWHIPWGDRLSRYWDGEKNRETWFSKDGEQDFFEGLDILERKGLLDGLEEQVPRLMTLVLPDPYPPRVAVSTWLTWPTWSARRK